MPITWPATLPLPSIEGYGIHPGESILRTEMEAGPARQRRRYTQVPSRVTVTLDNVSREIVKHLDAAVTTQAQIEITYRPYLSTDLEGPQMDPPITMVL